MEAALKKEVGDIKASTEMRLRRFQSVESGANNVVFIRTLGIEPEKLVHHILQDIYQEEDDSGYSTNVAHLRHMQGFLRRYEKICRNIFGTMV